MDAQEALLQRDTDILKPTDYNYVISFIGAALEVNNAFMDSIRSINTIAQEKIELVLDLILENHLC